MDDHKHCVFCGAPSNASSNGPYACTSKQNYLTPDTVGNRPHAYHVDNREKARAAVARVRATAKIEDISIIEA